MSDYTTVVVERETLNKIKRIGEATRRKNIDVVALAIEMYEKSIEAETPTTPTPEEQNCE